MYSKVYATLQIIALEILFLTTSLKCNGRQTARSSSPVVLEFDLKLIARKPFSTASYTEKYALQHTESPKESSEGKAWKMSHTVNKFIRMGVVSYSHHTFYNNYGILV